MHRKGYAAKNAEVFIMKRLALSVMAVMLCLCF